MKRKDWLYWILVLIAVSTALTGSIQLVAPAFILRLLSAETTTTSQHFFAIVGMFMVLFGGLALHGVYTGSAPPLLWAALQKFGAVGAVVLGVSKGVFSLLALAVAGFDLLSALIIIGYWRKLSVGGMAR